MPVATFDQLFSEAKKHVPELSAGEVQTAASGDSSPALIDVREKYEWDEGHIPGAVHVPRGYLELRIENTIPDKSQPILLYCAGGVRSVLAARTLQEMGYTNIASLEGGYTAWKDAGKPFVIPRSLSSEQM